MFLVNSSVGSFAAAPTSLDARVSRSKNIINHDLSISVKNIVFKKGFDNIDSITRNDAYSHTLVDAFIFLLMRFLTTLLSERGSYPPKWGQTLSRSYGRCIAEFLSEGSLVSLSLLDSSTCVGLRYGRL